MALATRVECDEERDDFGGKSNGNESGRRLTATRAMATASATTWVMWDFPAGTKMFSHHDKS